MIIELAMLVVASLLVIVLSALFSSVDTALLIADDIKMSMIIEQPNLKARTKRWLTKIAAKRDKHMAASMVFMTFQGVATNSLLGVMAYKALTGSQVVIFMFVLTYANLVFARTLPKTIASNHYEAILTRFAWLARIIYYVSMPMVLLTMVWVKLFRLSKRKMNLNELKSTINYYHSQGLIENVERRMLQNVFRIKQHSIQEVLEPATLPTVQYDSTLNDCRELAQHFFGKRMIVKRGDDIVGIMYYHDLATQLISERGGNVADICRQIILVQADEKLIDVMVKMKASKVSLVVVLDGNGQVAGVSSARKIYSYVLTANEGNPGGILD